MLKIFTFKQVAHIFTLFSLCDIAFTMQFYIVQHRGDEKKKTHWWLLNKELPSRITRQSHHSSIKCCCYCCRLCVKRFFNYVEFRGRQQTDCSLFKTTLLLCHPLLVTRLLTKWRFKRNALVNFVEIRTPTHNPNDASHHSLGKLMINPYSVSWCNGTLYFSPGTVTISFDRYLMEWFFYRWNLFASIFFSPDVSCWKEKSIKIEIKQTCSLFIHWHTIANRLYRVKFWVRWHILKWFLYDNVFYDNFKCMKLLNTLKSWRTEELKIWVTVLIAMNQFFIVPHPMESNTVKSNVVKSDAI